MEPKYQKWFSSSYTWDRFWLWWGSLCGSVELSDLYQEVYREKEGLRLVSINKDYKDIYISYDENPRIVGKIVGDFMPLEL